MSPTGDTRTEEVKKDAIQNKTIAISLTLFLNMTREKKRFR